MVIFLFPLSLLHEHKQRNNFMFSINGENCDISTWLEKANVDSFIKVTLPAHQLCLELTKWPQDPYNMKYLDIITYSRDRVDFCNFTGVIVYVSKQLKPYKNTDDKDHTLVVYDFVTNKYMAFSLIRCFNTLDIDFDLYDN